MNRDEFYMKRCIQLARNGQKNAQPNPMVGAVIVCDGKIIGEGYHVRYGEGHAEVNAIASVKDQSLLERSTIYVSLEPCSHYGKTPPCADLIVSKHIPRVVVGTIDPFAKVSGRGIEKLRQAGIDVTVGVCENECRLLNKRFFTFHSKKRPFVTLKWAQSADGFISAEPCHGRTVISDWYTQMLCHKRRTEHQAILVGKRTALADNPSLNVREWVGPNPVRLVLDRANDLPRSLSLFDGSVRTLVFTSAESAVESENVELVHIDFSVDVLPQIMDSLYTLGIQTLLVEGGRELLQSFIDAGLWDEAYVEKGTVVIGNGTEAPSISHVPARTVLVADGHEIIEYRNIQQ